MTSQSDESFFSKLWHEVEPVLIHTIVAGCIAVLVSLLLIFLGKILPEELAKELHKIDNLLILGIFWSLALYTLSLLILRLLYHLIKEGIQLFRKLKKVAKGDDGSINDGNLGGVVPDTPVQPVLGAFRQPTTPPAGAQATQNKNLQEEERR